MTRRPPVLRNSGDGVTDFPDQWHPFKTWLNPAPRRSCVPAVCTGRHKPGNANATVIPFSGKGVSQAQSSRSGRKGCLNSLSQARGPPHPRAKRVGCMRLLGLFAVPQP